MNYSILIISFDETERIYDLIIGWRSIFSIFINGFVIDILIIFFAKQF